MSPPPSSKGGFSPNDGSGFFSSIAPRRLSRRRQSSISLLALPNFLYNPRFSAFMPAEKNQGEPAQRPERNQIQAGKKQGQQSLFLDRS
ncbi:MAG: hypothetical protein V4764_15515 [Burkholderia sp.]